MNKVPPAPKESPTSFNSIEVWLSMIKLAHAEALLKPGAMHIIEAWSRRCSEKQRAALSNIMLLFSDYLATGGSALLSETKIKYMPKSIPPKFTHVAAEGSLGRPTTAPIVSAVQLKMEAKLKAIEEAAARHGTESLEKRMQEKRQLDPSFEIARDVLVKLSDQITESGRELEGVVTRLHATWQYMRQPITLEVAEQAIRDLIHGQEPRRIRIDEILKVISRHYGVPKTDLLSERRHRSVVWPRQIGMYLAKQLTSRSLPEIGRRFGGRDHTTVLHAIRKIESHLAADARLQTELDELKKLLGQ
jgi:hypothetical protein